MHLHLDPLGGIAGDMFAAALLDARPDLLAPLGEALAAFGLEAGLPHAADGALTGRRFALAPRERGDGPRRAEERDRPHGPDRAADPADERDHLRNRAHDHPHEPHRARDHDHDHDHGRAGDRASGRPDDLDRPHDHGHVAWRSIRAALRDGRLEPPVAERAVAIFSGLARAEARVHGVEPDAVAFHEVGAADSIGDIVAAAWLVERIGIASASVGTLPLGRGRIRTAHGIMPVPAPATAILLEGFETVDDGIAGERVTPTGAAILANLVDPRAAPVADRGRLAGGGFGFGTARLPGIANCLRALLSERPDAAAGPVATGAASVPHRTLAVLAFEVDDQTAEDLACGVARIRAVPGVHDLVQIPVIGKKGRLATRLEVLADPARAEAVIEACFRETTTIGLRHALVGARALRRATVPVAGPAGEPPVRVKLVERPGGRSGKAEADDIARAGGDAASRARARAAALARALEAGEGA